MKKILAFAALLAGSMTAVAQNATFHYFKYAGDDVRFQKSYDSQRQYLNPVLAGFYPDPAICRVGDTYYMTTSTFSFFPGMPLFQSKDLVNWQQTGSILDRESQLPLKGQAVSAGLFAPDIKYNPRNKTFYMITTNVGKGNFFVKTTDPSKGWSEPVYLPQVDGIDPSFYFDEKSDRAYIVHNGPVEGGADYEGQRAIRILAFDVKGDSVITRDTPQNRGWWQIVRGGTHVRQKPFWIEAPHLYRIGKYYYLMCAEGGTCYEHSEVIFRAPLKADITKPESWEENPNNPILTQRDVQNPNRPDVVTSAGHADLVQTAKGEWYAVFLACRPYEEDFYNTGRDTYMLPVTWKDGWPEILPKQTPLPTVCDRPASLLSTATVPDGSPSSLTTGNFTYTDRFDTPTLHQRWMFLRNPSAFHTTGNGLTITPKAVNIAQRESPSAIFCRQQHLDFSAETSLNFTPSSAKDLAGFVLLQNEDYNFVFGLTLQGGKPAITLTRAEKQRMMIASAVIGATDQPVRLKVEGKGRYYSFFYAVGDGNWQLLAQGVDAINLSTGRSGGFIGECIGLYATKANL